MNRKVWLLFSIIALVVLLCGASCNQSQQQKALTVSKNFAASMVVAQQGVVVFATPCTSPGVPYGCGLITIEEDRALQYDFKAIAACGPKVDAALVANNKDAAVVALTGCTDALDTAINKDAAGIKNPLAKAQVTSALLSAKIILTSAMAFLQ